MLTFQPLRTSANTGWRIWDLNGWFVAILLRTRPRTLSWRLRRFWRTGWISRWLKRIRSMRPGSFNCQRSTLGLGRRTCWKMRPILAAPVCSNKVRWLVIRIRPYWELFRILLRILFSPDWELRNSSDILCLRPWSIIEVLGRLRFRFSLIINHPCS